jgi:hypothetical protein
MSWLWQQSTIGVSTAGIDVETSKEEKKLGVVEIELKLMDILDRSWLSQQSTKEVSSSGFNVETIEQVDELGVDETELKLVI